MHSFDGSTTHDLTADLVLRELWARAERCGVQPLVVGALARDLLIGEALGSEPTRATADIDLAVAVDSWNDFDRFTDGLPRADASAHKFRVQGVEVDVLPFHGVETPGRTIEWPDEHVMQVLGFQEALATSVTVRLPHVEVRVASLPAQAVLKVLAWRERHLSLHDPRDARDLRSIITAYSEGSHLDQLYEAHEELLATYDFDVRLAGADRLGYEALSMLADEGAGQVADLVAHECSPAGRLPAEMGGSVSVDRELLMALFTGMRRRHHEHG